MRLQSLLAVLKEGTKVSVVDTFTNIELGRYDDKNSFAEVLNHIQVESAEPIADELDVAVKFDALRYFRSSSKFSKLIAKNYILWKADTHILGTYESDYGTMYLDTDNYLHTLDNFICKVITKDDDFVEYVMKNLEKFDEERLAY